MNKYSFSAGSLALFVSQIIAHVCLFHLVIYGSITQWFIAFIIYFFNGCIGMTITYHRLLSHKSFTPPIWFQKFGLFCATIGLTGPALSWVAIHREHHRHTDTESDPHSPKFKGWFYTHFLSMFIPVHIKYVTDLLKNSSVVAQHKYYYLINIVYGLLLYIIDPYAVIYAWLAPAAILWNCGSLIVSTNHYHGKPTNGNLLGLLVWGEGYHLNHHINPTMSRFSKYDFGGLLIERLFSKK